MKKLLCFWLIILFMPLQGHAMMPFECDLRLDFETLVSMKEQFEKNQRLTVTNQLDPHTELFFTFHNESQEVIVTRRYRFMLTHECRYSSDTGYLKYSFSHFWMIGKVYTSKEYDDHGNLVHVIVHTPDDYLDRVKTMLKETYHLTMFEGGYILQIKKYQGELVLLLMYPDVNSNQIFGPRSPKGRFVLLNRVSFEPILAGVTDYIIIDEVNRIPESLFFVDGQEIKLE